MIQPVSLPIRGYQGRALPNAFLRQPSETDHLGVLLPGYRHTADRADLYYTGRVLLEAGADLLRVDYDYPKTDFPKRSEAEQGRWIASDVETACEAALSERDYTRITLVGKSLGTLGIAHLLGEERFRAAACVWLTPLLNLGWLRERIQSARPRSLFVIGTADRYYDPEVLAQLEKATDGRSLVLEGLNHGLEDPNSVAKSLEALRAIISELAVFVSEG